MFSDFLLPIATYFSLVLPVWLLFVALEQRLRPESRRALARALSAVETASPSVYSGIFAALFDQIFGSRHWTWFCFWRSCIASTIAIVTLCMIANKQTVS